MRTRGVNGSMSAQYARPASAGPSGVNLRQIAIGAAWLMAGAAIYAIARPPAGVVFLPERLSLFGALPAVTHHVTGQLPVFVHMVGVSTLLAGVVTGSRRATLLICLLWGAVEAAFEVGQLEAVGGWLAPQVPPWFDRIWLLDHTRAYFTNGTFDALDLVAVGLGAAVAYLVVERTSARSSRS